MSTTPTTTPIAVNIVPHGAMMDTQVSGLSDRDNDATTAHSHADAAVVPTTPTSTSKAVVLVPPESNPATGSSSKDTPVGAGDASAASITYAGQDSLTPLPIPELEATMQKFLQSIEALDEDPLESKRIVKAFYENEAPRLQKMLLEYDRLGRERGDIGSYVEEFWNDSYLAPDSSVVLNLNPFFVLEDSPDPKIAKHPVKRAASLCFASVKMASQLRMESLKPDTFKGKALCMDQFKVLFASARMPMKTAKDSIYVFEKSNHIAVLSRGNIYYFQALWSDGQVAVDEADIAEILEAIQSHSLDEVGTAKDPLKAQQSIGVLTSLPRNEWAEAREHLIQHSPKNEESLKIVDSALFVLVLDDYIPKNRHEAAANMLHGSYLLKQYNLDQESQSEKSTTSANGGNNNNNSTSDNVSSDWLLFSDYQAGSCCNRWYDKLQIIVCGDGTAGINFEHSAIDGHTALRFCSDVYADTVISFAQSITKLVAAHDMIPNVISATVKRAATTLDNHGRTTLDVFPKKVHFDVPEKVHRKIYYAETSLGDEIVASETYVLEFKDYGKTFITGNKMSPDSFVQMSMMLAYYKLYGRIVCAYEPVLTKNFYHGRTEAMRPATMEAKKFCELFTDHHVDTETKISALRHATKVHSQHVRECSKGMGIDRHLFALKCIAEKNNVPIPAFFHSRPWKLLNHTILSTSNCGNPALAGFGFGPVVPDGLGIGYIIKDHQLHYSISSKHRQTKRYAYTLESVLRDMAHLFAEHKTDHAGAALRANDAAQRQSLSSIPIDMISYDSYGDIWGESCPPSLPGPKRWSPVEESYREEEENKEGDTDDEELVLNLKEETLPDGAVIVGREGEPNDQTKLPPGKMKRRGSKDSIPIQPPRRKEDWELSDRSVSQHQHNQHGQLEGDAIVTQQPSESLPATINEAQQAGETNLAVPRRHFSGTVGHVHHVDSIDYAALSQKGIQIGMSRKSSSDNESGTAAISHHKKPSRSDTFTAPQREASFGIHELTKK